MYWSPLLVLHLGVFRYVYHVREIGGQYPHRKVQTLLFSNFLDTNTYAFIPPPKLHQNFRKACRIVLQTD